MYLNVLRHLIADAGHNVKPIKYTHIMKPLKYTETKQINGRERRTIEISLADECQNGICNFQVETKTEKLVFGYWQRCYCGEKQRNAERKTFKNLIAEV